MSEKTEKPMWNGIEIYAPIPDGWEPIAMRWPLANEWLLTWEGKVIQADTDWPNHWATDQIRIILRRKTRTVSYAVARFEMRDGDDPISVTLTTATRSFTKFFGNGENSSIGITIETVEEPVA